MRRTYWLIASLVVAIGFALSAMDTAHAAPIGPASVVGQNAASLATPVHCRVYRHCHRRCWWWRGVRRCGRYCHRCG
jgi:hypothetical protein